MPDYMPIDFSTNAYFTPQESGDGTSSLGQGDGMDWMDWSQLPPEVTSSFLTPRDQITQGAYRGDGFSPTQNFSLANLQNFLGQNNYSLREANNNGAYSRGMFDASGNIIGKPQEGFYGGMDPAFTLGTMFLNPFGGIAAGGAAAGAAGSMGFGKIGAQALNSAITGGIHAAGSGGNILRSAAAGGLAGGYSPDVAGAAGLGDGTLGQTINGAIRGGAQSLLSGGNVGQGAAIGGAFAGLNSLGSNNVSDNAFGQNYSRAPWANNTDFVEQTQSYAPWAGGNTSFVPQEQEQQVNPLNDFLGKLLPEKMMSRQGLGDTLSGLMGMYSGYRRRNQAADLMRGMGANRDSYLANMRGALQSKYAQQGRRSNIGGREVELQAKLAELDSRNAPAMAALSDARFGGLEQMMASGLRAGGNLGFFGPQYERQPIQQQPQQLPTLSSLSSQPVDYGLSYDPVLSRQRPRIGGY